MIHKPAPSGVHLWRLRAFVLAVLPSFLCGVLWDFDNPFYWIGTVLWIALLMGVLYVYIPLYYRGCRYIVEEESVSVYWGVFFRQEKTIGQKRIQYASISQTLPQRMFGVATVVLHAAGGKVILWDLEEETALQIKEYLSTAP